MFKPTKTALAAATMLLFSGFDAQSAEIAGEPPESDNALKNPVTWDKSITLKGGAGYKDNVLLNKHNKQKSAFWLSAADFFVIREQEQGNHLTAFGSFEDRRYFSTEGVNKEQIATSQVDFKHDFGEYWQAGLMLQYLYLDQVLDVSITENISQAIPVKAHALSGAPYLVRKLPWGMRLDARFEIERQFIKEPLDDFWEAGPRLTLTKRYGHRSDIFLSYGYHERAYDKRRQFSFDFSSIPDSSLRFRRQMVEAGIKHYWDEPRRWRTTIKGTYERNEENGSGFYDYNKYRASIQGAYVRENWEIKVQGKVTQYDFDRQPVEFGNNTVIARTQWGLNSQLRRTLYKTLAAFLETDHEWVESNFNLESYHANTIMGGLEFEW